MRGRMRKACVVLAVLLGAPGLVARAQVGGPAYDAVTVKPSDPAAKGQHWHGNQNRVSMENVTLRQLIKVAYGFRSDSEVIDGPDWIGKQHWDISARMDDAEFAKIDKMNERDNEKESQLLLQQLLAERFGLKVRLETRALPQFALVVDGAAPKMKAVDGGSGDNTHTSNGKMEASKTHMPMLAAILSNMPEVAGRVVVDKTGLTGAYDFELNWLPERGGVVATLDSTLPGLFTALREQLGLKLEKGEGPVPVAVVEMVAQPSVD